MIGSRIEILRGLLEKNPEDARARFFLASELFRASEWGAAATEFERYLSSGPADPASARKSHGLCLERLGRIAEAAEAYRRAVDEALDCGHAGLAEEIRMLLDDLQD